MFGRRKIAALVAEFLGTGVLTLLILSVQRSTIGVPFFVAIAGGLAVMVMTFAVDTTSGGYLNPALTLAMWTARKLNTLTAILYIAVEMLGGWAAYALFKYYSNAPLQAVGGHYTARILVAEAVGTGIFAFGYAAAVYKRYTATTFASMAGLSYTLGVIGASSAAIGLLNPAVALGIRSWVWGTYVLGPVVGAIIGVNLYALLFAEPEALIVETTAVAVPATKPVAAAKAAPKRSTRTTTRKKPAAKRATAARTRR